ncbi:hypothetical protein TELCIR_18405, partial [Teladorsagia circumcincta]
MTFGCSMLRAFGRTAYLTARFTPQIRHPNVIASLNNFDQTRRIQQTRWNSNANPQRKGFLGKLIENVKEELEKNKELQEHQKQLKKRMEELNESEALKDARKKFARIAAEHVEKIAEKVGDTEVYKQVSSSMKVVKDEIDTITDVRMYSRPEVLKKRTEGFTDTFASRTVEANEDATGITLHKDSRWYAGWKKFSEENVYYNKLLDWKIRYEESDNIAVRLVRGVTERISSVFGSQNEVSEVLTEIAKIDPSFDKAEWLRFCEKEVIPNVLEAFIRGDLEVLQDWCHER